MARLIKNQNPHQKRRLFYVFSAFALLGSIILSLALTAQSYATGESYSFADSGSKITGKNGILGSSLVTFNKAPTGNTYTGSATISNGSGGTCVIGLSIAASGSTDPLNSGSTSGVISAPPYLNEIPQISAPGSAIVDSCTRSYAAGVSDLNKTISIGGSTTDATPVDQNQVSETAAQREIIPTVYSNVPISSLPSTVSASLQKTSSVVTSSPPSSPIGLNTSETAGIDWNTSANIGSARFENEDPGWYSVCILPKDIFPYAGCKTVNKVSKQALVVYFGSSTDAYNQEGKLVKIHVVIKSPAHGTGTLSYGPVTVNILTDAGVKINTGSTDSQGSGASDGVNIPAQEVILQTSIDGIDPGKYQVCIDGQPTLCSAVFTKEANSAADATINVAEDKSSLLLSPSDKSSCPVDGVGWIVCPVVKGLGVLNDGMWGLASSLLNVNPIKNSDPIYAAWGTIRSLANIAFVIIFIIIIFSQLSNVGVTNYGVKKMLPRLMIGAILVNVSFLIIQIAVDVSNIVGSSLYGLIVGMAPAIKPTWSQLITLITSIGVGTAVTAGGVAVVGGAAAAFWILLPMAAIAVLGLLAAMLTLMFRQAAIPILAILAPLAFVAFLLPNTETWFKKWRSMFVSLLMLYPLAAVVFGGAQFAAAAIINEGKWWEYLLGLLILALPLFSLPFLARQGGPMLSKVSGAINGLTSKLGKPVSSMAGDHRELAQKKYDSSSLGSRFNITKRMRASNIRSGQARKAQGSAYDRTLAENTDADILAGKFDKKLDGETLVREKDMATLRMKKRDDEQVESAAQHIKATHGVGTIGKPNELGGAEKEFMDAFSSGDTVRARAAASILASSGPIGVDKLHSAIASINSSTNPGLYEALKRDINGAGVKPRDAALAKWAYTDGGDIEEIRNSASTYSGLSVAEAASQTAEVLRRAQAVNGISADVAAQVLSNPAAASQLTDETRAIFEQIRGPATPTVINPGDEIHI